VRVGVQERDLPVDEPPLAEPGWLDEVPAELHGHLDRALGQRSRDVVAKVLQALSVGARAMSSTRTR